MFLLKNRAMKAYFRAEVKGYSLIHGTKSSAPGFGCIYPQE